jgi:hypothetical protein
MRPMTSTHDGDTPGHTGAVAHHLTDDHGDDHGHDDHAHGDEQLGPIDVAAWGAGALGIALGIVVAVCFALATGDIG